MFKSVAFATLLTASCVASAATWNFTYTGFDDDTAGFLSDRQLAGSFSGNDVNSDGTIDMSEISSLVIAGTDYMTCGAGGNPYFSCGAERFSYQVGGKLDFLAGITSGDPEGFAGGAHYFQAGVSEWEYRYTPSSELSKTYYWRPDTQFFISSATTGSPLPAVPEPGTWAMLAAGLALVAGVSRRRASRG